ncbi:hypothetical protein BJV82DRAFT_618597 [Fennellomyces sp. T-0311]|nr:hypothetical protein BJV82DRAFT_618597 [Fennellomyces sp. T-0311]
MADAYPFHQPIIRLPKSKTSSTSTRSNRQDSISLGMGEPKDTIVTDTLYFDGLAGVITETEIRNLLHNCQPTEIVIHPNGTGHLRFAEAKTADRVYSLYNGFTFPNNNSKLQFRISQDGSFEHEAKGPILHVKNLPLKIDNNALYDLFRPFGPLSLCKPIVEGKTFRGTAFVQYFFQGDSDEALHHMHNKMLEGNVIDVASFMPTKARTATTPSTDRSSKNSATPTPSNDKTESGYVDYMNLYIKNLDPAVTNNDLFNMFRKFGRIISARVMSNPQTGQSKGYGFVSYDKVEEATAALAEMNGKVIGAKQLIVAYHEPKKPRQEKQHHTQPQHNNNNSSPVANTIQPFMGPIGTPVRTPPHASEYGSNHSTAAAAAAAVVAASATNPSAGMGAPYSSHENRHPYDMPMPSVPVSMPSQVNGLGIDNVDQIAMTMKSVGQKRPSPPHPVHRKFSAAESNFGQHPLRLSPPFSSSPMSGVSSTVPSLVSLASGLNVQPRPNLPPHHHHHQQPQQQQQDYRNNGRPTLRRKGSLESVSSVMTESSASVQRQRLMEAVSRCGDYGKSLPDIVDMLLTLKRKERSLCLFNHDFLREKIQLALDALDTFNEDDDDEEELDDYDQAIRPPGDITPLPSNNSHSPLASVPSLMRQAPPQRVSKAIPIVAPPPEPAKSPSPNNNNVVMKKPLTTTNGTSSSSSNGHPQSQEVEQLLSSLEGKPVHEKKQQLGDRLFPLVKVKDKEKKSHQAGGKGLLMQKYAGNGNQTRAQGHHPFAGHHRSPRTGTSHVR